MSTATDAELIALGERFEKLLLEHMDAWLEWAPRMRAALAEVRDNTAALAPSDSVCPGLLSTKRDDRWRRFQNRI